jgi:tetratricopeptide (TPR) repeat protein
MASGDADKAIETFEEILRIVPDSAHANHAISILYQGRQMLDQALTHASRALQTEPDTAHRHIRVGEVLIAIGQPEAAVEMFEKGILIDDSSSESRFLHSTALERLGNLSGALASAKRAMEIAPNDPRWRDHLKRLETTAHSADTAVAPISSNG